MQAQIQVPCCACPLQVSSKVGLQHAQRLALQRQAQQEQVQQEQVQQPGLGLQAGHRVAQYHSPGGASALSSRACGQEHAGPANCAPDSSRYHPESVTKWMQHFGL